MQKKMFKHKMNGGWFHIYGAVGFVLNFCSFLECGVGSVWELGQSLQVLRTIKMFNIGTDAHEAS